MSYPGMTASSSSSSSSPSPPPPPTTPGGGLLDDLRTKISKLNKEIEEQENRLEKQRAAAVLNKKLKSLRTENDTIKVSIEKNKIKNQHSNNLIASKI